jgi:hypothetical protein
MRCRPAVERRLAGATKNPNEASKKVKLKMLLMKGVTLASTFSHCQ